MLDILLADDEAATRMSVASALAEAGHHVTEAEDGEEALTLLADRVYDVAIFDVRMPKLDGLSLFRRLRVEAPGTAVILMTAYATIPDAVASLREGAFDYVTKPFDCEEFSLRVIGRIAERRALRQELEQARAQLASREVGSQVIGACPPMVRMLERIDTLAHSDAPIFISGEVGTGKELVARTLHARSARRLQPFIVVNCAAFPEALLEAELFGHNGENGVGPRPRDGRFKAANGGTLFLDDMDEIPLPVQARLLRVLEEGAVEPLGGNSSMTIDVRIISSSRGDLKERMAKGAFREDLFYRLNVLDIHIPPLRERRADLPLLLQHFLQRYTPAGKLPPGIAPRAWVALCEYPFPGNVREFAHAVERAVVLAHGSEIDLAHLPTDIADAARPNEAAVAGFRPLGAAAKDFERQHILRALQLASGKRARAADLLGISRKNLWEKLRQHGLSEIEIDEGA